MSSEVDVDETFAHLVKVMIRETQTWTSSRKMEPAKPQTTASLRTKFAEYATFANKFGYQHIEVYEYKKELISMRCYTTGLLHIIIPQLKHLNSLLD